MRIFVKENPERKKIWQTNEVKIILVLFLVILLLLILITEQIQRYIL